ncbi:hypothetical protein ACFSSC_10255 [Corynebacterium mendelii]|uniref:Uncharacterized protein n=1 Tax=Corynebacterium mendelii TaxID=2765362 RepID=A0A939IXE1_9CORY|nr:hypothetical protein [Corynebacterium mendelii]MBN9644375.1 hypothetical protein [Corynebacterium mendelii]
MSESNFLYVRLLLDVPGAARLAHAAELRPDPGTDMCTVVRMVEMADGTDKVTGGYTAGKARNMAAPPLQQVPHPDQFHHFPDISHESITPDQFNRWWAEAVELFADLQD